MADLRAEMSGTITQVLVKVGDTVSDGQDVIGMESMKMEMFVTATASGKVTQIHVKIGDFVNDGQTLITLG